MNIRALNQDSSSSSCFEEIYTKEAQEDQILKKYNSALKLQANEKHDECLSVFLSILKTDIVQMESKGQLSQALVKVKYLSSMNAGNVSLALGHKKNALDFFDEASEIEKNDVTLWYKMGTTAIDLQFYRRAVHYFVQGLEQNPKHWLCIDKLIMLLYATNDFLHCLIIINGALETNPLYLKGLVLRHVIAGMNRAAETLCRKQCPNYIESDYVYNESNTKEQECKQELDDFRRKVVDYEISISIEPERPKIFSDFDPIPARTWIDVGQTIIDISNAMVAKGVVYDLNLDADKLFSLIERDRVDGERQENGNEIVAGNVDGDAAAAAAAAAAADEDRIEEIVIEDENEEEAEGGANKKKRSMLKKRRSDITFLQPWFWHTARKKTTTKKFDRFNTIEEALESTIYSDLLKIIDTDETLSDEDKVEPEIVNKKRTKKVNPYFKTKNRQQIDDVAKFPVQMREKRPDGINVPDLMQQFLNEMVKRCYIKWPERLVTVFSEIYAIYKSFFLNGGSLKNVPEDFYEPSLINAELNFNRNFSFWILQPLKSKLLLLDDHRLIIRLCWIFVNLHIMRSEIDSAEFCLSALMGEVEMAKKDPDEDFYLEIVNCHKDLKPIITSKGMDKMYNNFLILVQIQELEKWYNEQKYAKLIEIMKKSFNCNNWKAMTDLEEQKTGNGRLVQLLMFLDALLLDGDYEQCSKWTEMCLHEIATKLLLGFAKMTYTEKHHYQKMLEKCLLTLLRIVEHIKFSETSLVRLTSNLSNLLRKEYNQTYYQQNQSNLLTSSSFHDMGFLKFASTTDIWILLHHILRYFERNFLPNELTKDSETADDADDEKLVPNSLMILFVAHDFLGRRSKCLDNDGQLLCFLIDCVESYLQTVTSTRIRNKIEPLIEQTLFCMYEYPSKKNKTSRHLADHNVEPLPLNWKRCEQLVYFLSPRTLPEFDSYKIDSISSDNEILFRRICEQIPAAFCEQQTPVLRHIRQFIDGAGDREWVEWPRPLATYPSSIRNLYFLLGDYYLKNNDLERAIKYLMLDLTINVRRFDTWAELALAKNSQIEIRLNNLIETDFWKTETDFFRDACSAKICYKQALRLVANHAKLLIEFGNFAYTAHSFCSRFLKRDAELLSLDRFSVLETNKNYYLDLVRQCFLDANTNGNDSGQEDDEDERWLHHYMLGKVSEKQREPLLVVLEHYTNAARLLDKKKASYPIKINYNDPQHLAIEALEILYRTSASILKMFETKVDAAMISGDTPTKIYVHLKECFGRFQKNAYCPAPVIAIANLIDLAVECLEECCVRFPRNYKAIYRLAHFYYHFNANNVALVRINYQSIENCYRLLLAQYQTRNGAILNGLFFERKKSNVFGGIYRIPTSEVDRPGNFAYHMERCLQLVVTILRKLHHFDMLTELANCLAQKPEPDKIYLMDKDRVQIVQTITKMLNNYFKTKQQ